MKTNLGGSLKQLIMAIVLGFSFTALADLETEKSCAYFAKNTFASVNDNIEDKSTKELVSKVSVELERKRAQQCARGDLTSIRDYDSCSHLCVEHGTSDLELKAAYTIGTKLSKKTRECQKLCKSFQLMAFIYSDGVKDGRESSPDCSGAVAAGDRSNQKSDLVRKVKGKKTSSESASKQ